MYPSRDLKILAERREYLQLRIALRREECAVAGREVADRIERFVLWGSLVKAGSVVGSIGAGLLGLGRRHPAEDDRESRTGGAGSWGRKALLWAPVALKAFKIVSSFI